MEGLEPPNLTASDPKSDAVTNFATSANWSANIERFLLIAKKTPNFKYLLFFLN